VDAWTDDHARDAVGWRYDPPYDFYDAESDPADAAEMFDPQLRERFRAVLDDDGRLEGFWHFRHDGDVVEVGVGLRPDLTGRGRGGAFANAALDYARAEWSPRRFRLFVAAWNERSLSVCRTLGFEEVGRERRAFEVVGEHEFVQLEGEA
jgi:ribosomal-protein-alanine N-acetyltransferase